MHAIPTFTPIGPRTSLYTPPTPSPGEMVVICTWLGAQARHIAKYTALYKQVAPNAQILVVQSNVPILVSSYRKQRRELGPAAGLVRARIDECFSATGTTRNAAEYSAEESRADPEKSSDAGLRVTKVRPKILLHAFSNGGTNSASNLLLRLAEDRKAPLPIACLVFDSCPGKGTYWKSYTAMVISLPENAVVKNLGRIAVHCILIALYTWIAFGNENPASLQRRTLMDEGGTIAKAWYGAGGEEESGGKGQGEKEFKGEGRAVYVYSEEDDQCHWEDITEHARGLKAKGWEAEAIRFEGSAHCAHFGKYEREYRGVVEDIWGREAREGRWLRAKL
ncbi:MAG: hypothetical protein MMC23_004329 [Stictis urceolatum]|nr:hypothetical protein [Stictis urceolata]